MRIFATLLVLGLAILPAAANEPTPLLLNEMMPPPKLELGPMGWNHCSPPVQPSCSTAKDTFFAKPKREECQAEMERYVGSVFRYRQCLAKEMERAILQVNNAMEKFRCSINDKRLCEAPVAEKAASDLEAPTPTKPDKKTKRRTDPVKRGSSDVD